MFPKHVYLQSRLFRPVSDIITWLRTASGTVSQQSWPQHTSQCACRCHCRFTPMGGDWRKEGKRAGVERRKESEQTAARGEGQAVV